MFENDRKCLHTLKKYFKLQKQRFFSSDLYGTASLGDIKHDNLAEKDFQKCFFFKGSCKCVSTAEITYF